mgnify:CR=1 FL=1
MCLTVPMETNTSSIQTEMAEVLAPLYDQLTEWEKLVDIYEVMVKNTQDPTGQIERLHMIAAIYERQLSQYDNAFNAYARALAIDPTLETTIDQLHRLAEVTSEWEKLAGLLAQQAENILDPATKVQMIHRLARVLEARLNRVDDAVAERIRERLRISPTARLPQPSRRTAWCVRLGGGCLLRPPASGRSRRAATTAYICT